MSFRGVHNGRHLVVGRLRRYLEKHVRDRPRLQHAGRGLLGEDQPDHRAVFLDLARHLRVVDLQAYHGAGRYSLCGARRPHPVIAARGVCGQKIIDVVEAPQLIGDRARLVMDRLPVPHPYQESVSIKRSIHQRHLDRLVPHLLRHLVERRISGRDGESYYVMHHLAVAGTRLGHLHPPVFGEIRRHVEVLILIRPRGLDRVLFRHLEYHVGLSYEPAFGVARRPRALGLIALGRALIDPGRNGLDLFRAQPPVVCPTAHVRVGVPRGHLAVDDLLLYRFCPRPHIAVGED